ncbi:MBL fold metallo-hydrolase [Spirosoma horti]
MATIQQITPSLYQIRLGAVNAFFIKEDGLTLIDTGYPGSLTAVFKALQQAGEDSQRIKRVILTHAHPDHAGSAAAIKQAVGVPILAHQAESPLLEAGISGRSPIHRSPGMINWLVYNLFIKGGDGKVPAVAVDERLSHGDVLPIAGGLQVLHTPGHSVGHMALLLKNEGVLIAGDLCANVVGLDLSTVYEDRALGIKSLLAVSEFSFDTAVFGHGSPLRQQANQRIKATFGPMRKN